MAQAQVAEFDPTKYGASLARGTAGSASKPKPAGNAFDPTKFGATPFDPTQLGATPVSHGASGEWTEPETGIIAGAKRGLSNLNPVPMVKDLAANIQGSVLHPKPAFTNADESNAQFEESLRHFTEHPIASTISQIPLVGPMLGSMAERLPNDPAGVATEAAVTGAGAALTGKALNKAGEYVQSRRLYAQERPLINRTPEGHLQNALRPDLTPDEVIAAGSDLKAGERLINKPVKDIDTLREAEQAQFDQHLMPTRRALIDPQASVVVPGSRLRIIAQRIRAIPDAIRLNDKPMYDRLVQDVHDSMPPGDLTLGDLENMNTSYNSINRAYHDSRLSGALSKLETAKGAMDVAAEEVSRQLLNEGMQKFGIGGAAELRNINARIGHLIKIQDAVRNMEQVARTQATMPWAKRILHEGTELVGSTLRRRLPETSVSMVNENIAHAMRRWTNKPADFGLIKTRPRLTQGNPPGSVRGVPAFGEVPPQGRLGGIEFRTNHMIPSEVAPDFEGPQVPPTIDVAGEPTAQRRVSGSGTEAKSKPLPARKTGLDYGRGRESDELQNWQYTGEMTPDVISRPEGPGTLRTTDPRVLESTIASIDEQLKTAKGAEAQNLRRIRVDLTKQLRKMQ